MVETTPKHFKRYFHILMGGMLSILPFFLILLPEDFFDSGKSICISRLVFDVECYGCGMTRAFMRILHGEFKDAWDLNKLSIISFPLILIYYYQTIIKVFWKWKS